MHYPVSQPDISEFEKKYVAKAMDSGWISSKGQFLEAFESLWAKRNAMQYGVACNSGTNALYLALKALRIGPGDEVIVPTFTMIASAWAVTYTGATPVFVDCKDDLTIDETIIESAITVRTKAIMPVHIYGRQCNMDAIGDIADAYNLKIIEDMAEAHGITPTGDVACYSFYGNKIVTTGEGGMCLTDDQNLAWQIRHLANMAFNKEHTFFHPKIGHNFRMTNLQAAIGYAQVERFDSILAARRQIETWYNAFLLPSFWMPHRDTVWVYDIKCDKPQALGAALAKEGIETRRFFYPMHHQPMYKTHMIVRRKNEPAGTRADYWSSRGLYLPTYNALIEEDIRIISNRVNDLCASLSPASAK